MNPDVKPRYVGMVRSVFTTSPEKVKSGLKTNVNDVGGVYAPYESERVPTHTKPLTGSVFLQIARDRILWSNPPEKEKCPTCNGSGKTYQLLGRNKKGEGIWGYGPCEYCGGSGYV